MTSEIPRISVPHLNLDVIKSNPVFSISISLASCSSHLCIPVSPIHVYITFCVPLTLLISQLMLCSLTPYIRLPFHVCYSILTLIIVSFLLEPPVLKHHSINPELQFLNFQKYSSFNLTSMLFSIKIQSALVLQVSALHYLAGDWVTEGFGQWLQLMCCTNLLLQVWVFLELLSTSSELNRNWA